PNYVNHLEGRFVTLSNENSNHQIIKRLKFHDAFVYYKMQFFFKD
ncbi:hypothetical protein SAMN05444360_1481, partial [Chryseobacterium carnipullorum]